MKQDRDLLADELCSVKEAFARRNPASAAIHERACAAMPGGNTRTVLFYDPFPLAMVRGEGCRLYDADGHEYLDFLGEYTAGLFGHSNPRIRAAVIGALDRGLNLASHHDGEPGFAQAVTTRFPSLELVRFTNSGTEANVMALQTALATTGRSRIVVFGGSYHGGVLYFGGTGGSPTNLPHDWIVLPYNDVQAVTRTFAEQGEAVAAVLVEPMLGSGGSIPATREFLSTLRTLCTAHGAVLVADEVMTSRLAPHGLFEAHGITPDLMTLGKYIGGGMSFGAFGGRRALMERYDPRRLDAFPHAGTFNNNVLTMAAGPVALDIYSVERAQALNAFGDELRQELNGVCRRRGARAQWTGVGSIMSFHATAQPIRTYEDVRAADPRLEELFFFGMLERRIYLARRGMIALSLEITSREAGVLIEALDDLLQVCAAHFA